MTNYKEILRLYSSGDYSNREIAKILGVSRNTIAGCIGRAKDAGVRIPVPETMSNEDLYTKLFQNKSLQKEECMYLIPDFERFSEELKKPHVTKKVLWREYVRSSLNSELKTYSISQFNALFNEYMISHSISMTRERNPGEVLELDWSGSSINLRSKVSDSVVKCHLFVAAFPFSGYFFAEAFANEKTRSWVKGITDSFSFFGGVPIMLRPDNCKTVTLKADKYEPELNQTMIELSEYYGTVTIPARVRKPRDKNVVENTVGFATRNIIAALRNQVFYSIDEINMAIAEKVDELNSEPFTKKPGSRLDLFLIKEKPCLLPLPSRPFELFERATAKVAPDYHIQFDKCFYSVHPKFIGKTVKIRANAFEVEVFDQSGKVIARHRRGVIKGQKSTNPDHIPEAHRELLGWSGDRFRSEAKRIGPRTLELIETVLASRQYEVQSFRVCRGILNLRLRYGGTVLETAAAEAVSVGIRSYKGVKALAETAAVTCTEDVSDTLEIDESDFFMTHDYEEADK